MDDLEEREKKEREEGDTRNVGEEEKEYEKE
jgi:hypothetical protein